MKRYALSAAVLGVLALGATGCAIPPPSMPTGSFPREMPRIPPASAAAARVPPGYRVEVVVRDLIYPTAVEFDDRGNLYVAEAGFAYGDPVAPARILRISPTGQMAYVADQNTGLMGPITDIMWHQGRLYVSHFNKISALGTDGTLRDLVTDLPASTGHFSSQMSVGPDGKIYFGMGAYTNSGVVGMDQAFPFLGLALWPNMHDVPPRDVRLRGETFLTPSPNNVLARQSRLVSLWKNMRYVMASAFSRDKDRSMLVRTGAFQPFGVSGNRVVRGQTKANATILRMNPDGSGLEVYAWGIRNPFGVRWGPDGRLYASDNGYDERGSRPIANALDNVWVIREGAWYGWPDYSSGIPVTDPQFNSTRGPKPEFLMAEHPPVEKPLFTRPKHAGVTKFDFSRSATFGFAGQMFLGEFGAGVPITGTEKVPTGHQVVRIDPATGQMEWFFTAQPGALGPEGMEYVVTSAPKHPVDVRFSPDGNSMYIADIGALTVFLAGAAPFPRPIPCTGVIWRVTRDGAPASGPPANLSPIPPRSRLGMDEGTPRPGMAPTPGIELRPGTPGHPGGAPEMRRDTVKVRKGTR